MSEFWEEINEAMAEGDRLIEQKEVEDDLRRQVEQRKQLELALGIVVDAYDGGRAAELAGAITAARYLLEDLRQSGGA